MNFLLPVSIIRLLEESPQLKKAQKQPSESNIKRIMKFFMKSFFFKRFHQNQDKLIFFTKFRKSIYYQLVLQIIFAKIEKKQIRNQLSFFNKMGLNLPSPTKMLSKEIVTFNLSTNSDINSVKRNKILFCLLSSNKIIEKEAYHRISLKSFVKYIKSILMMKKLENLFQRKIWENKFNSFLNIFDSYYEVHRQMKNINKLLKNEENLIIKKDNHRYESMRKLYNLKGQIIKNKIANTQNVNISDVNQKVLDSLEHSNYGGHQFIRIIRNCIKNREKEFIYRLYRNYQIKNFLRKKLIGIYQAIKISKMKTEMNYFYKWRIKTKRMNISTYLAIKQLFFVLEKLYKKRFGLIKNIYFLNSNKSIDKINTGLNKFVIIFNRKKIILKHTFWKNLVNERNLLNYSSKLNSCQLISDFYKIKKKYQFFGNLKKKFILKKTINKLFRKLVYLIKVKRAMVFYRILREIS